MKWKLHKLLSIIMVFALMVCLLPHPVAQAANDKSRIKTAINKYMVAVKGYNSKRIDKCLLNKKAPDTKSIRCFYGGDGRT